MDTNWDRSRDRVARSAPLLPGKKPRPRWANLGKHPPKTPARTTGLRSSCRVFPECRRDGHWPMMFSDAVLTSSRRALTQEARHAAHPITRAAGWRLQAAASRQTLHVGASKQTVKIACSEIKGATRPVPVFRSRLRGDWCSVAPLSRALQVCMLSNAFQESTDTRGIHDDVP